MNLIFDEGRGPNFFFFSLFFFFFTFFFTLHPVENVKLPIFLVIANAHKFQSHEHFKALDWGPNKHIIHKLGCYAVPLNCVWFYKIKKTSIKNESLAIWRRRNFYFFFILTKLFVIRILNERLRMTLKRLGDFSCFYGRDNWTGWIFFIRFLWKWDEFLCWGCTNLIWILMKMDQISPFLSTNDI